MIRLKNYIPKASYSCLIIILIFRMRRLKPRLASHWSKWNTNKIKSHSSSKFVNYWNNWERFVKRQPSTKVCFNLMCEIVLFSCLIGWKLKITTKSSCLLWLTLSWFGFSLEVLTLGEGRISTPSVKSLKIKQIS